MNLAIVGYGKMGRLIEQLAPEYGFNVGLKLDEFNNANFEGITRENFRGRRRGHRLLHPLRRGGERRAHRRARREHGAGNHGLDGAGGSREGRRRAAPASAWFGAPTTRSASTCSSGWCPRRRGFSRTKPNYGAWAWEIHHSTKKDAPSGTLLKLVEEMKQAGYARPVSVSSNRAGAHPGHARDRFRLGGGHHHPAAFRAQPGGVRARGAQSGTMGGRQEGLLRIQRSIVRRAVGQAFSCPLEVVHVYGMRHRAGHAVQERPVAG